MPIYIWKTASGGFAYAMLSVIPLLNGIKLTPSEEYLCHSNIMAPCVEWTA